MDNQINNTNVKETEITQVINNLNTEINMLSDSIEVIESRLVRITRNSSPSISEEKLTDTPYNTHLAISINTSCDTINDLRKKLNDLIERIEL
jgi:predicted RNase H-like nuclease (RuvC/YqgF family)